MNRPGKYRSYEVVHGEDYPRDCYYTENKIGTDLLRVHYRVTRLPSEKRFTLRHLQDASPAERARTEQQIPRLAQLFESWESIDAAIRRPYRGNRRCALFVVMAGTPVEDPLIQLELEMMIDQGQDQWLTPTQTADALGVTVSDLVAMRAQRTGPAYFKPNLREILYSRAEIDTFRTGGAR